MDTTTMDTTTMANNWVETTTGHSEVVTTTIVDTTTVQSEEGTPVVSVCPWCSTTDEGPVSGQCCQFPFLYQGESHHSCVEVEDGRAWCSTKLGTEGEYLPGQWGYCGEDCFFETPSPALEGGKFRSWCLLFNICVEPLLFLRRYLLK